MSIMLRLKNHQKWKSLIRKKTSTSTITIKQLTPKDGKAKNIDYTASKKLKQHHYLVVSEKSHTITSYKEVKQSDIPTKAKEKL